MVTTDPRQLQWARFNDFSPGIADRDFRAAGNIGPWPLGTAEADETYGCRALPSGALGPLPEREQGFTLDTPANVDPANPDIKIVGFLVQGPVQGAGATTGYDEANYIVAREYLTNLGGANTRQFRLTRVRMWNSTEDRDTLISDSDDFTGGVHRTCWLESSRIADTDPTTPGYPVVCFAWYGNTTVKNSHWGFWPNPASPTTTTPRTVANDTYDPGPMVVYQGRSVIFDRNPYVNGPGTTSWSANEEIYFTNTNLPTLSSALASVFTPEDPGEILGVCVSDANELFVLKRRSGAYVIRGDIVLPTVLRVPGVIGVGKQIGRPLASPIGVVYNSLEAGIYVWPGGEDSTVISDQLEPNNFEYDLAGSWEFQENYGRADYFQDLLFIPPGFLYDWKKQAWWRLEDPDDLLAPSGYLYFQKSLSKRAIIAARGEYRAGEPYAYAYNFDNARQTYTWKSHPIPTSIDQDIETRMVILKATGVSGSTVTVEIISRGTSESHVFTLDGSTYPRLRRDNSAVAGNDIQVRITTDGGSGNAAPIVYSVEVAYYETQTIPEKLTA